MIAILSAMIAFAQEGDPTPVPQPPAVVELGRRWIVLEARVGDALSLKLVDPAAPYPERTFSSRNGPPGFVLAPNGAVTYLPQPGEVGRWRIPVRIDDGHTATWSGVLLHVRRREGTVAGPTLTAVELVPEGASPPAPDRPRVAQGCFLGLGLEAAAGVAPGSTWQHVGETGVQFAASPHGSIACTLGDPKAVWIIGLDSAPYVAWPREEGEGRHALALFTGAQFGTPTWKVGPIVTGGALLAGLGVRGHWLGFGATGRPPMGLEAHVLWLAPRTASASIGWLWAL